jgi:hypothetical protein
MYSTKLNLSLSDYLLGMLDVAGELNRYALNSVAAGTTTELVAVIRFLRDVFDGKVMGRGVCCCLIFHFLAACSLIHGQQHGMKDFSQKYRVLRQSLLKVEWAYLRVLWNMHKFEFCQFLASICPVMWLVSQLSPRVLFVDGARE